MDKDLYNKLSRAMQIKTDKVIDLKLHVKNYKFYFIMSQIFMYSMAAIILMKFEHYTAVFSSMFINTNTGSSHSSNSILLSEFVLIIFFVSCICVIYCNKRHKKLDDKYKTLRLDIINLVQNEFHTDFCKHEDTCSCRDEYIDYMKKWYDIDVVIK
jgi:hypothetical protein